jgi:hypothetical protein
MISRSTLKAAIRVAEHAARRTIGPELGALTMPLAVNEPSSDAAGVHTPASWAAPADKAKGVEQ